MMQSDVVVTGEADSYDLTVIETVKPELGIAPEDTSNDERLTLYIHQVSGAIAGWCNRVFASETVEETFWHDGSYPRLGAPLMLSRSPVSSIASVTVDGTVIDASLYRIVRPTGHLFSLDSGGAPSSWSFSTSLIVAYVGGYALLDDLPFEIERAAIEWLKDVWYAQERDPRVKSETNFGVARFDYFDVGAGGVSGLPAAVTALLQPYRKLFA